MGTNFYMMNNKHIGKRSAAGLYCFDCDITLYKGGNEKVHSGEFDWWEKCPRCGRKIGKEVRSCCSFTWSISPIKIISSKAKFVKDEYGKKYSMKTFIKMLNSYPIHFYHSIGEDFT